MQPQADALAKCPFLGQVAAREGPQFALKLAANPFCSASASTGPLLLEEEGYAAMVRLWHGPGGVVPLRRFEDVPASSRCCCPSATPPAGKPRPAGTSPSTATDQVAAMCKATHSLSRPAAAGAPFASMSISGFGFLPDPGRLFRRLPRSKQQQKQQQRKASEPGNSRSGNAPNRSNTTSGGSGNSGWPGATSSSPGVSSGGSSPPAAGTDKGYTSAWGRAIGSLIPLAANGQLACPVPIVKMRAAVAALKPVKQLRPQALPIRALAMGGTAIAANLPCGMWREHTKKFSPQWFLAVHATIPFVAMLRKAVLMPKWAILLTVAGAIAGQNVGARIERKRMADQRTTGRSVAPNVVMAGIDDGCQRCLSAAQAAIAWTLAPVVVAYLRLSALVAFLCSHSIGMVAYSTPLSDLIRGCTK